MTANEPTHKIGEWRLISTLGAGSFGTVTLWRHVTTNQEIAIKKCKFHHPTSVTLKQRQRWQAEVAFMQTIQHPNIVKCLKGDPHLLDVMHNPTKLPMLCMEYCRRGNLRHYLQNEPIRMCGLPEPDVRSILTDISCGLAYLHSSNITHRDIKPDNIVLDQSADRIVYKIIDLGYAKELDDATLSFVGTLHYLAPEVFFNDPYDFRVDYWSMGTMAFELITGSLPFLPEVTPFERFQRIKSKSPDDITIYTTASGSTGSAKEIRQVNFLTTTLKAMLELWLRQMLQTDPRNRMFPKAGITPFDYLRYIFDRRIIQVFHVAKSEFYSYEMTDSTDLLTLMTRDCNMADVTLLTCNELVYVYKDGDELQRSSATLPRPIKSLFSTSNQQLSLSVVQTYRATLHYLHTVRKRLRTLLQSFKVLIDHILKMHEKIVNVYRLHNQQFDSRLRFLSGKCQILGKIHKDIERQFDIAQIDTLYQQVNSNAFNAQQPITTAHRRQENLKKMRDVVSLSLKYEINLYSSPIKLYHRDLLLLYKWTEQLHRWVVKHQQVVKVDIDGLVRDNALLRGEFVNLVSTSISRHREHVATLHEMYDSWQG